MLFGLFVMTDVYIAVLNKKIMGFEQKNKLLDKLKADSLI